MKKSDLFPSPYYNGQDTLPTDVLTIAEVTHKKFSDDPKARPKTILAFKEPNTKLLPLNKTNWDACEAGFGLDDDVDWVGQRLTLGRQRVLYQGKPTWGVLVMPQPPKPATKPAAVAKPQPAADTDPTDEEYGFDDDAREGRA